MVSEKRKIRPARQSDLSGIFTIYNEAIVFSTASYHYQAFNSRLQEEWFDQHRADALPLMVAEQDGAIAGWCSISRFKTMQGYRFTGESSVYVAENFRGRGIGEALLRQLLQAAYNRSFHTIIACIDSTNEASLGLHEKLGFTRVGELKEVGYKFDRWLNLTIMQHAIS
jgi:L-amino acid N-acyltransferase